MKAIVKSVIKSVKERKNPEQMGKHSIQCFKRVTYHMCVFNMACTGT